jgi:hypothetical protein
MLAHGIATRESQLLATYGTRGKAAPWFPASDGDDKWRFRNRVISPPGVWSCLDMALLPGSYRQPE